MQKIDKRFVYHRALNTPEDFTHFVQKSQKSNYNLVAEGDVCWAYIDNTFITYIHHPQLHGKSLSDERVKELVVKNELFTLEKLFAINSEVSFILELKTGTGDKKSFFEHFKNILKQWNVENVIVDAFSVEHLRVLKSVMPQVQTSLHTKYIFGQYVLETSYEKPYIRLHKFSSLPFVNTLTISFASTHVNLLNLDIDTAYAEVFKTGKSLHLGAIKSLVSLEKALDSQCSALYLRSKEVLNGYTKVLEDKSM